MNAIDLLEVQHREIAHLFSELQRASPDAQQELFERFAAALIAHTAIEEKHLYPSTRTPSTQDFIDDAMEDSQNIKRLVAELWDERILDQAFSTKLDELGEALHSHIQDEEQLLFPRIRSAFRAAALEVLGEAMQATAEDLGEEPREVLSSRLRP